MTRQKARRSTRRGAARVEAAALIGAVCLTSAPQTSWGQGPARGGAAPVAGPPKLVVLVVLDQFRADTLARHAARLGPGGFRRLLSQGAVATGHYGQQNTYTGPGHATVVTGSFGYRNGVIQNRWWNRATGRVESMLFDERETVLNDQTRSPEDETSPRNLLGTTVFDELRRHDEASRVVAVALKGRGALLLGGHLGAAYFFSEQSGQMTTSTYYGRTAPGWVQRWNAQRLPDRWFGQRWERLLPASAYTGRDDAPFEADVKGLGRTFPHLVTGGLARPGLDYYEALLHTPFGLDMLMDFARAALDGESLGRRGVTDALAISISSTDLVGHAFGPDSQEYQDIVLRVDRALAVLLGELDRRFRPGEVLLALTADHGATPIPEQLAARGLSAGRIKKASLRAAIGGALQARFGPGEWIDALEDPSVYLNQRLLRQRGADPARVQAAAGEAALTVPGMLAFYTRAQLLRGEVPPTEAARAVVRSYFPARAGDVILVTAPHYFWGKYGERSEGSTHGSFYRYDTDVPVVLVGPWFAPGEHGVLEMEDLAATLSHALRLAAPPSCEGRPARRLLR